MSDLTVDDLPLLPEGEYLAYYTGISYGHSSSAATFVVSGIRYRDLVAGVDATLPKRDEVLRATGGVHGFVVVRKKYGEGEDFLKFFPLAEGSRNYHLQKKVERLTEERDAWELRALRAEEALTKIALGGNRGDEEGEE